MPIPNVAVDDAVKARDHNLLATFANAANGRAVFASPGSTVWQVPAGVNRFRVFLAGGGGSGGHPRYDIDSNFLGLGGRGGNGLLISRDFTDAEEGTSYSVTVGTGGNPLSGTGAGTSSAFGVVMTSNGGSAGANGVRGADGSATGGELTYGPQTFYYTTDTGFGQGGNDNAGGAAAAQPGAPGICVIEW